MFKNKLKASLIHLLLSFVLVLFIMTFIVFLWFPPEYLSVTNFTNIAIILIAVDLILGPLLTFVVFNPKKKSLRFDLAVIAAIQISALAYGVNTLYNTHPLFITYNHNSFNLVQANEVTPDDAKYEIFRVSKLSSPKLAFAKMPEDPKKQYEIKLGVDMNGEPDIEKRTEYFEPYTDHLDTIIKNSINSKSLFSNELFTNNNKKFIDKYGDRKEEYAYVPLKGISGNAIIVLDKTSGDPITTLNVDPWMLTLK